MYRDRLTLRQLWVRIRALPADSPLHRALHAAEERAAEEKRAAEVDDVMTRYRKG